MEKTNMQVAKERVMSGEGYLHIKNLPSNTVKEIIEYLNNDAEFRGDWAIGLKYIWDVFKGMILTPETHLQAEIDLIKERLVSLESQHKQNNQAPIVRLADGGVRKSRT